jgi:hypothetical protein
VSFRATGALALATLALGAFVYFHEIRGGAERGADAEGRLFPGIEADAIESIALVTPDGGRVRAVQSQAPEEDPGHWRIVEPLSAPGDKVSLDAMARSLAEMSSTGRIADPAAPSVYGLAETKTLVVFVHGGREHTLGVGRETPLGGRVYVSISDGSGAEEIHMLPFVRASVFDRGLDDLRDRRLLAFNVAEVSRLTLAAQEGPQGFEAVVERRDDGWEIVSPALLEADAGAVDRLLSDLSLLRAETFVDEPTTAEEVAVAQTTFVAELEAGGALHRFELGAAEGGVGHLRLARGRDGRLYRVRTALVMHFPTRLFALRAKQLARFDPADARVLQLDLASGESIRTAADETVIATLSRLDAIDVIAEDLGPAERAALELEPARARIRVLGDQDVVLADIHFGRSDPKRGIVARAGGISTIYLLDSFLDEALPLTLQRAAALEAAAPAEPEPATEAESELD